MEIAISVIYLLIYTLAIVSVARCVTRLTLLKAIPFAILAVIGINSIGFALLAFAGVGYSIPGSLIINLAITLLGGYYGKAKGLFSKEVSLKSFATKNDVVAWIVLGLIAVAFFFVRFGFPPQIAFVSSDAAAHYGASRSLFEGGLAKRQFCSYLCNAMTTSSLGGFFGFDNLPELFLVSETLILYLGALCLYSLVAHLFPRTDRFHLDVLLGAFYACGMPMNSLIYGFSYLSFSVVVISGILLFLRLIQEDSRRLFNYAVLSLFLYQLVISYSLFVPSLYAGVALSLVVFFLREKKSVRTILERSTIVFLLPVLLGCVTVYYSIFGYDGAASVGSVLRYGGGTYLETYGQYLVFLPLIMYGVYCAARSRELVSTNIVFLCFFLFVMILGVLLVLDRASAYYFSKVSNALWLGAFVYIACAIENILTKSKELVISLVASYLFMFGLFATGIDSVLVARGYNTQSIGDAIFPIQSRNVELLHAGKMDEGLIDAYEVLDSYVNEGIGDEEVSIGILNPNHASTRWFQGLYGYPAAIHYWEREDDSLFDLLKRQDYVFLGNGEGSLKTKSGTNYLDLREKILSSGIGEVVYSNDSGLILKISE